MQTNLFQNNTTLIKQTIREKTNKTFLVAELLLFIIFITHILYMWHGYKKKTSIFSGRIVSQYS